MSGGRETGQRAATVNWVREDSALRFALGEKEGLRGREGIQLIT